MKVLRSAMDEEIYRVAEMTGGYKRRHKFTIERLSVLEHTVVPFKQ